MAKKTFERNIEPLEVRKARHAAEAPVATKEYKDRAKAVLAQMAKLKAERLEREKKAT
jgi:hypothetical protein